MRECDVTLRSLLIVLLLLDLFSIQHISLVHSSPDSPQRGQGGWRPHSLQHDEYSSKPGYHQQEDGTEYRDYSGHALMRIHPQNDSHLLALSTLARRDLNGVDFWNGPVRTKRNVDMLVAPDSRSEIASFMRSHGLQYTVLNDNLQRSLDAEKRVVREALPTDSLSQFNLSMYHTYDQISAWLDYLNSTCGTNICRTISIGKTTEGRDIKLMKIGTGGSPAFWIDAGIHAREWISPSTAVYIISKLLDPTDKDGRYLASRFTWYILPVVNPDGYSYTWTADRLWRKTRSKNRDPKVKCRGADPNRNWNFHWGGRGTSDKPCSENYAGVAPFSEPETRAMADFLLTINTELSAYVSLHSYGQYWLTPWGYTYQVPDDYKEMMNVAKQSTDAIKKVHGVQYEYGSASRMLYLASGGSDDWVKGVANVKYSYTVELRDQGSNGFILPPSAILPTGQEMLAGIRAAAGSVLRYRRRRHRARSIQ